MVISILIFSAGVLASDTTIVAELYGSMRSDVTSHTDTLVDEEAIKNSIKDAMGDTVTGETNRAITEIEGYYNQQISDIANSPIVANMKTELSGMADTLIDQEKRSVDKAINAVLGLD